MDPSVAFALRKRINFILRSPHLLRYSTTPTTVRNTVQYTPPSPNKHTNDNDIAEAAIRAEKVATLKWQDQTHLAKVRHDVQTLLASIASINNHITSLPTTLKISPDPSAPRYTLSDIRQIAKEAPTKSKKVEDQVRLIEANLSDLQIEDYPDFRPGVAEAEYRAELERMSEQDQADEWERQGARLKTFEDRVSRELETLRRTVEMLGPPPGAQPQPQQTAVESASGSSVRNGWARAERVEVDGGRAVQDDELEADTAPLTSPATKPRFSARTGLTQGSRVAGRRPLIRMGGRPLQSSEDGEQESRPEEKQDEEQAATAAPTGNHRERRQRARREAREIAKAETRLASPPGAPSLLEAQKLLDLGLGGKSGK